MIIERADTLGLSQLHQLRGRVGRGRERAYAYFLYPPEKPLTETAHERLATIAQHSDLGGGMAIAMKDLEIRGAGNLLGGEQSGHIADVGFDLYVRLVGEAVNEFKGEARGGAARGADRAAVDAHLPARLRPERAAAARDVQAAGRGPHRRRRRRGRARSSTTGTASRPSRWPRCCWWPGSGPGPAQAGLSEVTIAGRNVRFAPVSLPESRVVRLQRLYPRSIVKTQLDTVLVPRPGTPGQTGTSARGSGFA